MEKTSTYRGYRDLRVYQLSFKTALEIHEIALYRSSLLTAYSLLPSFQR
jgi:hypothetical protein